MANPPLWASIPSYAMEVDINYTNLPGQLEGLVGNSTLRAIQEPRTKSIQEMFALIINVLLTTTTAITPTVLFSVWAARTVSGTVSGCPAFPQESLWANPSFLGQHYGLCLPSECLAPRKQSPQQWFTFLGWPLGQKTSKAEQAVLPRKAGWIASPWLDTTPELLKWGNQDLRSPLSARQALLPWNCLLEIVLPSGVVSALETSMLLSQTQYWLNKGQCPGWSCRTKSHFYYRQFELCITPHLILEHWEGKGAEQSKCGLSGQGSLVRLTTISEPAQCFKCGRHSNIYSFNKWMNKIILQKFFPKNPPNSFLFQFFPSTDVFT